MLADFAARFYSIGHAQSGDGRKMVKVQTNMDLMSTVALVS